MVGGYYSTHHTFLEVIMKDINNLSIDIETYSSVDLSKCGVYKYAESEDSEILLFSYSVNDGDVKTVDIASGEKIPDEILKALVDESVTKWAYNANFERIFISVWLHRNYPTLFKSYADSENYLNPQSWRCTMVWSAYLGLPLSLEGVGKVLNLENQKMKEGKQLIRYFSKPCSPTKANGGRTRNLPKHAPDKWSEFKEYNKRDVEVEMSIKKKLANFPVPDFLWDEYVMDQHINDRGILIDDVLVENAIKFDAFSKTRLMATMKSKTELENPNSVVQMKEWLKNKGIETDSLDKNAVTNLIKTVPSDVADVLLLRQQLAKSSVKKYQAMKNAMCKDSRAHGMFQFYGANRTGRWAGRIIQLQNLRQNHMSDLKEARIIVRMGDYDLMNDLYEDVPDTLSQLLRTAFIPRKGYKFIVCDFAAIEARVLSYLANETWRNKVFKENGDIYCASASAMFHVKVEKHGENAHLRQKGKIAELALGYGGSVGALTSMGALDMGLEESELKPLVDAWRNANNNIVSYWWEVDKAVKNAVKNHKTTKIGNVTFFFKSATLFIKLPSGRSLAYPKPLMGENQFGGESVTYEGVGVNRKWDRLESYGPKFVENIVQAISRDILSDSISRLEKYNIVGHVHDEVIIECPVVTKIDKISRIMGHSPDWMPDILLRADGYECEFYMKD